eukprot:bmy_22207T0
MAQSRRGWRGLGRPKHTTSACGLYWMLPLVCIVFVWKLFSSTSLHINLTDAPALVTGARRTGLAVSAAGWSGPAPFRDTLVFQLLSSGTSILKQEDKYIKYTASY